MVKINKHILIFSNHGEFDEISDYKKKFPIHELFLASHPPFFRRVAWHMPELGADGDNFLHDGL
jgi:hypothetical protein